MEQTIIKVIELEHLFRKTVQHLSETIDSFSEANFNTIPFAESWTPAQVAEHALKSFALIHQTVNGSVTDTTRNPEEHIGFLKKIMEDMNMKTKSAANILPGDRPLSRSTVKEELSKCAINLIEDIRQLDLSQTCMAFEFPGLGYITRYEMLSFAAFHAQRHIHQLKNIFNISNHNF